MKFRNPSAGHAPAPEEIDYVVPHETGDLAHLALVIHERPRYGRERGEHWEPAESSRRKVLAHVAAGIPRDIRRKIVKNKRNQRLGKLDIETRRLQREQRKAKP